MAGRLDPASLSRCKPQLTQALLHDKPLLPHMAHLPHMAAGTFLIWQALLHDQWGTRRSALRVISFYGCLPTDHRTRAPPPRSNERRGLVADREVMKDTLMRNAVDLVMKDDESRHVRDAACALFSGKRVEPLDVRRARWHTLTRS